MLFKTLNGHTQNVPIGPYILDWNKPRKISKVQREVETFLRPYWMGKQVLVEFRIPSTRLRIDLMVPSDELIVEVDGSQHMIYNSHFHVSLSGYRASIGRDLDKEKFAENNGFTLVRITEDDVKAGALCSEWFKKTYNVTL